MEMRKQKKDKELISMEGEDTDVEIRPKVEKPELANLIIPIINDSFIPPSLASPRCIENQNQNQMYMFRIHLVSAHNLPVQSARLCVFLGEDKPRFRTHVSHGNPAMYWNMMVELEPYKPTNMSLIMIDVHEERWFGFTSRFVGTAKISLNHADGHIRYHTFFNTKGKDVGGLTAVLTKEPVDSS